MSRINGKAVGGYRINGKIVGGIRSNGKLWDGFEAGSGDVPIRTGVATRVGTERGFKVSEFDAVGLTSHGGKLYMVGSGTDRLYTLDTDTGVATRVGTSNNFGVSRSTPSCLASHGGTLYLTASTPSFIGSITYFYTLDTTTGAATRVGSTQPGFNVGEQAPTGLASHSNVLYFVGTGNDSLYTLNPTTGVGSKVGTLTRFGRTFRDPIGLASHDAKLYTSDGQALFTLNAGTGALSTAATSSVSGVMDMASHNGIMYMITDRNLYTLA